VTLALVFLLGLAVGLVAGLIWSDAANLLRGGR